MFYDFSFRTSTMSSCSASAHTTRSVWCNISDAISCDGNADNLESLEYFNGRSSKKSKLTNREIKVDTVDESSNNDDKSSDIQNEYIGNEPAAVDQTPVTNNCKVKAR